MFDDTTIATPAPVGKKKGKSHKNKDSADEQFESEDDGDEAKLELDDGNVDAKNGLGVEDGDVEATPGVARSVRRRVGHGTIDDAVGGEVGDGDDGAKQNSKRRIRKLSSKEKERRDSIGSKDSTDDGSLFGDGDSGDDGDLSDDLNGFIVSDDDEVGQKQKDDYVAGGGGSGDATPRQKVPPVVSHWNLAEYLPPYVEECFLAIVGQFLLKPFLEASMNPQPSATTTTALAKSPSAVIGARTFTSKSIFSDPDAMVTATALCVVCLS